MSSNLPVSAVNSSLSELTSIPSPIDSDPLLPGHSAPTDRSIVFIDSTVADLDRLTAGIKATVITLDASQDGVAQITAALAQRQSLDSIHIISHGQSGDVQLGSTHLNQSSLAQYADHLQQWGRSLSAEGDLLFYGCNVAAGTGKTFIQQISDLTGADVQASDDLTGSAALGGDWDLEVATGAIEAQQAIDPKTQANYEGVLASRNGKQYVLTGKLTWVQAQAEARRLGGNLVTIGSKGEEKFLKRTFGTKEKFWTGLSDRRQEGQFTWAGGDSVTYRNWAGGRQPVNGRQDFTVMNVGRRRQWDDRRGNAKFRGIVEIPETLTFNGKRYRLTASAVTYTQAYLEAERLGGQLVTFDDAAEKAWLRQNLGNGKFWTGEAGRQPSGNGRFRGVIELPGLGETPIPDPQFGNPQLSEPIGGVSLIELERNSFDDINEADGSFEFAVVRIGNTDRPATASVEVSGTGNSPAKSGEDYIGGTIPVSFAPGEVRKVISIPLINDNRREGTEQFVIKMQSVSGEGVRLGTVRTANVTLLDDESNTLDVTVRPVAENAGNVNVRLTRSNSRNAASVNFFTTDGTAIAGADYTTVSQLVRFNPGESSKTIQIPIIDNATGEEDETFNLNFSNPSGLALERSSIPVTINDNDALGFTRDTRVSGLFVPTSFDFTPNGDRMYILEKSGVIKTVAGTSGTPTVFADLSRQVSDVQDRGGLSIAVHPRFYSGSPYIYVSYTYDPPEAKEGAKTLDGTDQLGNRPARVSRLTADPATGAFTGEEVVILGKNSTWANISNPDKDSTQQLDLPESGRTADGGFVQDYVKTDSQTHTIGQVRFSPDGQYLYVSIGDGASYRLDPRAASTLNIDSLSGKMLRIDPITGQGIADNPYFDGNPNSNRSKVWQSGLRNSFRFGFKPGDNDNIFLGDVGWNNWEEVNVGGKGANFGWPAYEGPEIQQQYNIFPEVQAFIRSGQPVTQPIRARSHADGARAVMLGDFYNGRLYVTDVNEGTIDALTISDQNQVVSTQRIAVGDDYKFIVQMKARPDGLYFVDLIKGQIGRFS